MCLQLCVVVYMNDVCMQASECVLCMRVHMSIVFVCLLFVFVHACMQVYVCATLPIGVCFCVLVRDCECICVCLCACVSMYHCACVLC